MKTMVFFEDLFESLSEFDKNSFLEYVARYYPMYLENASTEELINELRSRNDFNLNNFFDEDALIEAVVDLVKPNDLFDEEDLIEAVENLGYNVK